MSAAIPWGLCLRFCLRTCLPLMLPLDQPAHANPPAGNTLEQVLATQQGQELNLTLRFSRPPDLAHITHFTTLDPPRLVFDFSAIGNGSGLGRMPYQSPLLKRLALASDARRSRLQLDLHRPVRHTLQVRQNQLTISLSAATDQPGASGEISDITFGRGAAGQAQIRLTLPTPHTLVELHQSGQQLVADIAAGLPASLRRRQDLADQHTPVQSLTALPQGGGTRLVIAARGQWHYQAQQDARQLLLELHADNGPALQLAASSSGGQRLSLNFHDIDVRAALQMLADFSGINLVAADSVGGRLSLRLHDLSWEQALDVILQARGLGMRRQGNVIWVAPREELLARERSEREQQRAIDDLAPLHAQAFQLNYQRAEALRRMLGVAGAAGGASGDGGDSGNASSIGAEHRHGLLSRRGSAMIDARTNQLFVTDTMAALANVQQMLQRVDVAARQVLIEARIVEADHRFGQELGVKLGLFQRNPGLALGNDLEAVAQARGQTGANAGADAGADAGATSSSAPSVAAVSLAAGALHGRPPASFALTLFNAAAHRFLDIELSALEANGRGRIVASPRVVTADQQAALIEQGEEIPYQQSIGRGASATSFKKANLKLEVTPQITPDGHIILDVDLNKDSRGSATPSGLAINTKHVRTQVRVADGGTVVIGGIYTETEREHEARVPLLGDIPLLGALFRQRSQVREKTELMIFLTPRMVEH